MLCNQSLLENEQCDPECDNMYCRGYNDEYLAFDVAHVYHNEDYDSDGYGSYFSADLVQCPTNYTLIYCDDPNELSVYMDTKVNASHFGRCEETWRGDGYCM